MRKNDYILLENLYTNHVLTEAMIDTKNFIKKKFLGGSTGADLYEDTETGEEWVAKFGANVNHMYNEYLSNKLYTKYGIDTPESFIGEIDGKRCLVTKYLKDSIPLQAAIDSGKHINISNEVGKGFLFDVIMANWDVVGTNRNMDNIRVTPDGKVWRVDTGGSTIYRAQGALKGKAFGEVPSEQKTLRDPSMGYAARFFQDISDEELKMRLKEEAKRYVVNGDKISHMKFLRDLRSTIYDESDVELPEETKQQIYRTIAKRVFSLYRLFN